MFGERSSRTRISLKSQPRYIYALIDPRDDTVRYVGVTQDVYFRLHRHIKDTSKPDKRAWINDLEQQGLSPELEILETIEVESDIDVVALEREKYWILEFLKSGAPLLNVYGIPSANPRLSTFTQLTPFGRARLMSGLSASQLAKEARVSSDLIYSIEREERVKAELAVRVCRVLSRHLGYEVTYQSLDIKTRS